MLEPQHKDLQDVLAGRLVDVLEDDFEENGGVVFEHTKDDDGKGSSKTFLDRESESIDDNANDLNLAERQSTDLQAPAFAKVEKSLISLGFFTPSSRRITNQKIKTITFTRTIDGKKVVATAEFHPSATLGLPITADQDKFLALHHIITNLLKETGTISNPIKFTSAEMLRLLNKERNSGKNYKDISEWLDVMMATTIMSNGVVYEAGKQRFARDRFHVFARAVSVGKEMPDGTVADANYVWLSDWQLENINAKFLVPIDLLTYRELKNHIAKALVPLLQVWLFASQRAGSFEKRYDELCEMLSLKGYKAASRITQQLKGSLDELTRHEYLEKWRIEKMADKRSFKIVFFHGPKFHRDRRRRHAEKTLAEATTVVSEWQPTDVVLPEPGSSLNDSAATAPVPTRGMKSVESPTEKAGELRVADNESAAVQTFELIDDFEGWDRLEAGLIDELSSRGLMPSSAMKLLRGVPSGRLQSVSDYIDYWDAVKKTKEVGEGFLYNLIKDGEPLPASFETRRVREARQASERRERNLSLLKGAMGTAYEKHCEGMIDQFIAEMPAGEFAGRVAVKRDELIQQGGVWDGVNKPHMVTRMAELQVRAEIGKGISLSYEDFCRQSLPTVLEKLGFEATLFSLGDFLTI